MVQSCRRLAALLALTLTMSCTDDATFTDAAVGPDSLGVDGASEVDGSIDGGPDGPPVTTITDGPDDPTNLANATLVFAADEPATFECQVDGGGFAACASPFTTTVADGTHTFEVRGRDGAGNLEAPPAQHGWRTDTVAPATTITVAPPAIDNSVNVSFEFTADEAGSFECRLDVGAYAPCTSPHPVIGLADGAHAFAVRAVDLAGNLDTTAAEHGWTIDSTSPDTVIDSGPAGALNLTGATFTFSSPDAGGGATFECRLDAASFAPCTSPRSYTGLAEGAHTFRVRVIDAVANPDPTPATRTWTIDLTLPETTIDSGPTGSVDDRDPDFTFSAAVAGDTFECALDAAGFAPCTSPHGYTSLGDGDHLFAVRALDAAGNVDPTPATRSWTIDTIVPDTTITAGPSDPSNQAVPSFTFTASEPGASFECRVDGGAFASCTSSHPVNGLSDGSHLFAVRARDAAGHVDPTPATLTWTRDTVAPTVLSVGSSVSDGRYSVGAIILVQVTFSEPVVVTGSPTLLLETGGSDRAAILVGGGGTILTFSYTVQAGDSSPDLDYQSINALTGGTLRDAAGNDATRILVGPGAAGSLGASRNLVIAASAPVMTSVSVTPTTAYTDTTLTCTPAATDPDGDTVTYQYEWLRGGSVIAGASAGTLAGSNFARGDAIQCRVTPSDGSITGAAMTSSTVTIANTTPVMTSVTVTPATAYTDTTLTCTPAATDADSDSITYTYAWLRGGNPIAGATAATLAGSNFAEGDAIACRATPSDGTVAGTAMTSAAITIANSGPVMTSVTVTPPNPHTDSTLTCTPAATDADSESITYQYVWLLGGNPIAGATVATLGGNNFAEGDSIACRVTPSDGTVTGTPMTSAAITIENGAPVMTSVNVTPATAYTNTTLTCTPTAIDPDSDAVTFQYAWLRNGNPIVGATVATLGGNNFAEGEAIACRATPSDGTASGTAMTSAAVTIANTAPVMTSVTVTPATAYTDTTLTCTPTASDADAESVTYQYAWLRGGNPIAGATATTLGGASFAEGESIACRVTPSDGTVSGAPMTSAAVTIANSAPVMTSVTVIPATAYTDTTLTCSPAGFDPDAESYSYQYEWLRDGGLIAGANATTLSGASFSEGHSIACRVTPFDGTATGASMTSAAITIANSPPVMTSVSVTPTTANTDTTLTCSPAGYDPDAESYSFQYQWLRDGNPIAGATATTLSGASFSEGQSIACRVTPFDGTATGTAMTSNAVTILNTPPVVTAVDLTPISAYTTTTLTCNPTGYDPDGESFSYQYAWLRNNLLVSGAVSSTLPGTYFAENDAIQCVVAPFDGTATGSSLGSNTIGIVNSPPNPPQTVTLTPFSPTINDTLACSPSGASDPDESDSIYYVYQWGRNGGEIAGQTGASLAPGNFGAGDVIECIAAAHDGTVAGQGAVSNSVQISAGPTCDPGPQLGCGGSDTGSNSNGSNQVSSYSCSGWVESGPEVVYSFIAPVTGTANVTLTGMQGGDLDLFVLRDTGTGCVGGNCVASGDTGASFAMTAGTTYYLVVDGYQGAVGLYTINLGCQ